MTSTPASLSLGLAGALGPELIADIAAQAEAAGFSSLWVNDTPSGDAVAALAAAARVTHRIRLATGVVPLDRRDAASLADDVARADLPIDRLALGIGSGQARSGQLALVERGIDVLRSRLDGVAVIVGALGPRMRRLATTAADGQLLNWLTPEAARAQRVPESRTVLYVRTALDPAAVPRLHAEADAYAGYPAYAANFDRLGFIARDTVISPPDAEAALSTYLGAVDEVVLRAIVADDTVEAYAAFIAAATRLDPEVRP